MEKLDLRSTKLEVGNFKLEVSSEKILPFALNNRIRHLREKNKNSQNN
jgi:hypothetical protein